MLAWTLRSVAAAAALFDEVVVVTAPSRWDRVRALAADAGLAATLRLVEGGADRQGSVRAGVETCTADGLICVHDAARPLCPVDLFERVLDAARRHGAATAALPVVDTIKRVQDGVVRATLDRRELVAVQTPQAFTAGLLRAAHAAAPPQPRADDDCALVERMGAPVAVVTGDPRALKVTELADLGVLATHLAAARP